MIVVEEKKKKCERNTIVRVVVAPRTEAKLEKP